MRRVLAPLLLWSALAAVLMAQAHTGTGSLPLPSVSGVTASGFTVTWTTSSNLNTQVWYSPHASPPTLGTRLANWKLVTTHTATIAGLATGVTYDVQVESSDYSNPDLVSPVFTITTANASPTLSLQPGSVTLQVGQMQAFTASYSDGSPVGSLTWSASNGGQISGSGVFTATTAGNFTVTADDGAGRTASAAVTVTTPTPPPSGLPIPTIANVSSTSFTLTWQTSQALNTQVHFAPLGSNQTSTYANWKLTTDHTAVISGLQAGATYAVVAESSYYSNPDLFSPGFTVALGTPPPARTLLLNPASSSLQVGQTQAFTASYSDGSPVGTLTWSAGNGGQISTAGVFTATAAGTFIVTATDGSGLSASAAVTVQAAPPTGLPVPSLSNLTATSFTLTWQTTQALNTQVQYTLAGSSQPFRYTDWTLTTTHTAVITGLQSGATYSVVAESSYYSNPDLLSPGFTVTLMPLTVAVTAPQTDLGPDQSLDLTALVTNDTNAAGVTWSISPNAGTLTPSDALHATYTAPPTIGQATTLTVVATSKADASKTATIQLTLHPVTVAISGDSSTALYPLQAAKLSATVNYDTHHQGVTWSLATNGQGTIGSMDSLTGVYTAPASITVAGTVTVVATSILDPAVSSAPITISVQPPPTAYWQNLVQFENGLARGTSKPYNLLATQINGNGVPTLWQPDLLIFHDTQTGTEIWRMSNDPSDTYIPGVINRTPWNANGSYVILGSTRNPNQNPYGMTDDWLYDARGGLQVPFTPFDPNRQPDWTQHLAIGNGFLPPDRIDPNIVYSVSYDDNNQGQWSAYHSFIYAINLAPNSKGQRFQSTVVADLPNVTDTVTGVQSATIRTEIRAQLADDDRILLNDFNDSAPPSANDPDGWPKFHLFDGTQVDSVIAANLNADPQNVPRQLPLLDSYSIHFNLTTLAPCAPGASDTDPSAPCHDPNQEWHLHDFYFQRDPADHITLNYGPRGDVGEYVDFSVPSLYNGDNSTISLVYPNALTPYYSHPGISDGYKMVVYFGEDVKGSNNYGVWVRDLTTGLPIRQIEVYPPFDSGHSDWSGFDPKYYVFDGWTSPIDHRFDLYEGLSSPTANFAGTGKPDRMLVHYPPRDPNNTVSILYSPTQSPDATKVAFTIPDNFDPALNAHQTTFIAVSHRPVPPLLRVSSTSPVTLSWAPYSPHNEVKGYHVYRASSSAASNFTEISHGLVSATTFTDSGAQTGQTYLYAVTAEEYSGLESNQLSNVMEVTAGGPSIQFAAAGTTGWDTTAPDPVTQPGVCSLGTNGDGAVVWKVTWNPSDSVDVRYHNVYVSLGNPPQAAQPYLVDSPPLGNNAYIYWQGDPEIAPQFGITAVDRQGNESTLTIINAAGHPSCP